MHLFRRFLVMATGSFGFWVRALGFEVRGALQLGLAAGPHGHRAQNPKP